MYKLQISSHRRADVELRAPAAIVFVGKTVCGGQVLVAHTSTGHRQQTLLTTISYHHEYSCKSHGWSTQCLTNSLASQLLWSRRRVHGKLPLLRVRRRITLLHRQTTAGMLRTIDAQVVTQVAQHRMLQPPFLQIHTKDNYFNSPKSNATSTYKYIYIY